MPSNLHGSLLELFRNRSRSAADLLLEINAPVPEYDAVRTESCDLSDLKPTEYRADLVLFLVREHSQNPDTELAARIVHAALAAVDAIDAERSSLYGDLKKSYVPAAIEGKGSVRRQSAVRRFPEGHDNSRQGDYGLGVEIHDLGGNRIITHGGAIEGFSTSLTYVPDRRIAVVVLANVIGPGPDPMSRQLVDATLGCPVTLASERKLVPISKEDLARFVGVYDLSMFSLTIAVAGDGLTSQVNRRPADGSIASLVVHRNWGDMSGKRKR